MVSDEHGNIKLQTHFVFSFFFVFHWPKRMSRSIDEYFCISGVNASVNLGGLKTSVVGQLPYQGKIVRLLKRCLAWTYLRMCGDISYGNLQNFRYNFTCYHIA
jgi:hypothetical protein